MSWFDTLATAGICLGVSLFALSMYGSPEKRTRDYAPLVTVLFLPALAGLGFNVWSLVGAVASMPLGQPGQVQAISLMEHPGPAMVQHAVFALLGLVIAYGFMGVLGWLFDKLEHRQKMRQYELQRRGQH